MLKGTRLRVFFMRVTGGLGIFLCAASSGWAQERLGAPERAELGQADPAAAPAQPGGEKAPTPSRFARGLWVATVYGSVAAGKSPQEIYAGHLGAHYHLIEGLSIGLEGVAYFVDQKEDTGGFGADGIFRWHFLRRESWSLYLDGGWGGLYTDKRFRESGTHFSFASQGGLGGTFAIAQSFSLMAGARWLHISNGDIQGSNRNPHFDNPRFYAGVVIPLWR